MSLKTTPRAPTIPQLGANLAPTWPNLGPTWPNLGPTWVQTGSQNQHKLDIYRKLTKNHEKFTPNRLKNQYKIGHPLKTPNNANGSPCWFHFSTNLGNFGANLGYLGANMAHLGPNLVQLAPNLVQLGTNLAPKLAPNAARRGEKGEKRTTKKICNMIFPRRPQELQDTLQTAPKTPETPSQNPSRSSPDPPKIPPRTFQNGSQNSPLICLSGAALPNSLSSQVHVEVFFNWFWWSR